MLTKDSFPLTHLFLCYQTLENMENYLYTRFSIDTYGAYFTQGFLHNYLYTILLIFKEKSEK